MFFYSTHILFASKQVADLLPEGHRANYAIRWGKIVVHIGIVERLLDMNLQQIGILYTDAGKSAFLTAMYIIFVPLIGIFLKRRPSPMIPVCVLLAAVGLYFLSCAGVSGINIGDIDNRTLLIVDETQNFTREALRAVLTRINNGKVVCIGCDCQIDLKYAQDSAFMRAIHLYSTKEKCAVCNLSKCYRGWVAELADEI